MTRIAFIGLGNMGGGMAARQVVGGREVHAFDLSEAAVKKAVAAGAFEAGSIARAVEQADVVITMLPAGPHVRKVYDEHILPNAPKSALLIDCSTIDVDSARAGRVPFCGRASVWRHGGGGCGYAGLHGRLR